MRYAFNAIPSVDGTVQFYRHRMECPESTRWIPIEPTPDQIDLALDCECVTYDPRGEQQEFQEEGAPVVSLDSQRARRTTIPPQAAEVEGEPREGPPEPPWRARLMAYRGSFKFLVDMQAYANNPRWHPSKAQEAAILKSLHLDGEPSQFERRNRGGISIRPLRGRYAVEAPNGTPIGFEISHSEGVVSVRVRFGQEVINGGHQGVGESYSGDYQRELITILTDPRYHQDLYGVHFGICPICRRRMTAGESRHSECK